MIRTALVCAVLLPACKRDSRHAPSVEQKTAIAPTGDSGSAGDPTFAMLKTPDGIQQASPEQTLATLRANCDAATRDNNFAVACFSLAQLYDTGTWVQRDVKLAIGLHDKSCSLGEMRACADLGVYYDDGDGVPKDPARAKSYFKQACDGGNGRGCNNLLFLHPDAATKPDIDYVLGRYRAICDGGGDAEACMTLGDIYRIGQYLPADVKRAVELYAKACAADHAMACNNLGAMRALGEGGPKDDAQAVQLYTKACHLGSREGCINAGIDPSTATVQIKNR